MLVGGSTIIVDSSLGHFFIASPNLCLCRLGAFLTNVPYVCM
nr:MAG TPA: hypothetical protein [Caudoviricetes sp.]